MSPCICYSCSAVAVRYDRQAHYIGMEYSVMVKAAVASAPGAEAIGGRAVEARTKYLE